MDQTGEVAEHTKEEIDERVSGAETGFDPDYAALALSSGEEGEDKRTCYRREEDGD